MLRLLLTILFLNLSIPLSFAIDQWVPSVPASGDNPVNFPAAEVSNNNSLSRLLSNYKRSQVISYTSTTSITVSSGEITCNSATPYIFRQNTSGSVLNSANLDTGASFSNSTTYYVYAICDANTTTNTYFISLSSSTPTGATNYVLLGSFTTDSSGNITGSSISNVGNNQTIGSVYDYGASASAYTTQSSSKMAHGDTALSSGTLTITNLPFTSSSSYTIVVSLDTSPGTQSQAITVARNSGSSATVTDSQGTNKIVHWIALGT